MVTEPEKQEKQVTIEQIDENSEISETDSSQVSVANVDLGTSINPKMITKIDLSIPTTDDFFNIPIKTKIKYPNK